MMWLYMVGLLTCLFLIGSHMCDDCDLWGSIITILYSHWRDAFTLEREYCIGSFQGGHSRVKTQMLRDVAERNNVLWKMGGMKLDCDISLENGLQYAMKFGIPLEEEWPLDNSVRPMGI